MNVTGRCKHSLCLNCTWASSCRRKREEMQLRHRYCLLWYLFQLHYDNTDMLRWSCRRRGWCGVCVCVYVGVCVFGEPVSKFIFNSSLGDDLNVSYIPLLTDPRPTFCLTFLFPVHFCPVRPPVLGSYATLQVRPPLYSHSAQVVWKIVAGMRGKHQQRSKAACETGAPWSEEKSQHVLVG